MPTKSEYELNKDKYKQDALRWGCENKEARRAIVKRYKRTFIGMILERYKEMRCRVEGKRPKGREHYFGLGICSKGDFVNWATTNTKLQKLYSEWIESGYDRKLSPSIDRVDSDFGYVFGNMQWLTLSENSSKGGKNKRRKYGS